MFAMHANPLESRHLNPKTIASLALAHRLGADCYRRHINLAAWALQYGQRRRRRLCRLRAAMRTILAANEHHAEARRASDSRELRFTEPALRRVGRDCRATVWTVESLCFHD